MRRWRDTPVLLIDGDLRTKGLSAVAGNLGSVGLAEVLSGTATYEDAVAATDVPNSYIVAAGTSDVPRPNCSRTVPGSTSLRGAVSSLKSY